MRDCSESTSATTEAGSQGTEARSRDRGVSTIRVGVDEADHGRNRQAELFGDVTAGHEDRAAALGFQEAATATIVRVSDDGISSTQALDPEARAECIFEHVYFARPDSRFHGKSVYSMRYAMGQRLAQEAPADVDLVIGVPDSGMPPAEGFAHELGLPFGEGLIKNRYVARTFIQPTQELREMGVRLKLNALIDNVAGKRLVVVDDSIVRGTTSKQIVRMLKDAGATEVHMRINSPEVTWPCFYGIDTDTQDQLISASKTVEEICEYIGADSLAFLSPEGLRACVPNLSHCDDCPSGRSGYCEACFTGEYPVEIPPSFSAGKFLDGYKPRNLAHASAASHMSVGDVANAEA